MSAEADGFWNIFESVGSEQDELSMHVRWAHLGELAGADNVELVGEETSLAEEQFKELFSKVNLYRAPEDL